MKPFSNRLYIIVTDFLPIVVSVAALFVSYWTYKTQFSEELYFDLGGKGRSIAYTVSASDRPERLDFVINAVLVNNSNRQIVLTNFEFIEWEEWGIQYIDYGVFDLKNQPIKFPLALPQGTPLPLLIRTAVPIHPTAYKILKKKYPSSSFSYEDTIRELAAYRIDLFGNKLKVYLLRENEWPQFSYVNEELKVMTLTLQFETSRGGKTSKAISWRGPWVYLGTRPPFD